MAGLERLKQLIYFEKQEEGSMLCAQHALNSLLQGPYFSSPDLSQIAKGLDELEQSYGEDLGTTSMNMDDTGFFSVQVLETALDVWGLSLTRWRGEQMRPYQDRPQSVLAFVLNYQQHWYTLRRFGPASANIEEDPGVGHWFNLNSFLDEPEWVSKLYLGMVLQQAEADGYSVFAVTQKEPSQPLALSRVEADELAANLPEPQSASIGREQTTDSPAAEETGFEDEDLELQAALHASLLNRDPDIAVDPPPVIRASVPLPPTESELATPTGTTPTGTTPTGTTPTGPLSPLPLRTTAFDEPDPIAASLARSRALLQEMTEEQHYAQRELWETGGGRPSTRGRAQEEEDEMLRRAIAESEAMANAAGHGQHDDDDMDVDERPTTHRVYDDDDAELQAALKASLEHVPEGWSPPTFESNPPSRPVAPPPEVMEEPSDDESDDVHGQDTPAEMPSVEEMRLKRLARFGG